MGAGSGIDKDTKRGLCPGVGAGVGEGMGAGADASRKGWAVKLQGQQDFAGHTVRPQLLRGCTLVVCVVHRPWFGKGGGSGAPAGG